MPLGHTLVKSFSKLLMSYSCVRYTFFKVECKKIECKINSTSNFVSYSSSFLIGFQVRFSLFSFRHNYWLPILFLHTTHTAAIVDFQFCFLFFQFSHWHPGVGFTFLFLLLGLCGMRDKLTIVKRSWKRLRGTRDKLTIVKR